MRLSNFIQDTLYEIALGVQLAQAKAKDLVAINPSRIDGKELVECSYVEFDVSVVVGEATQGSASGSGKLGGEINVASIVKVGVELGGSKASEKTQSNEQTHRVAFKVPVYMNAHYGNNPAAAEHAALLLKTHQQ